MALLIGHETDGGEAEVAAAVEIGQAFSFKALKTGTLTALHVKFSANGTGTKSRIAIQADEAGKPKAGAPLAEAEITSNAAGEHEATGLSAAVTEGTTYWLTFLPLGGNAKYKPGNSTPRRQATEKRKLISEITAGQWGAETSKGPISIWGTGTEGGKTTYESAVSVRAGAATSVQAKNIASASVAVRAGSAVKAAATMIASATMDHPTPRVTPFVTGKSQGIVIEAGARNQVAAKFVAQTTITVRAGTRLSTASQSIAQSSVALRAGARVASSAKLVVMSTITLRTGAITVVSVEAAQFVQTWTVRGSSTLIPALAGDTTVVYGTASDEPTVKTYAGDA